MAGSSLWVGRRWMRWHGVAFLWDSGMDGDSATRPASGPALRGEVLQVPFVSLKPGPGECSSDVVGKCRLVGAEVVEPSVQMSPKAHMSFRPVLDK